MPAANASSPGFPTDLKFRSSSVVSSPSLTMVGVVPHSFHYFWVIRGLTSLFFSPPSTKIGESSVAAIKSSASCAATG